MTDDEFEQLTREYVVATEARLALIRGGRPSTPDALSQYREVADREWEIGLAWDAEILRGVDD